EEMAGPAPEGLHRQSDPQLGGESAAARARTRDPSGPRHYSWCLDRADSEGVATPEPAGAERRYRGTRRPGSGAGHPLCRAPAGQLPAQSADAAVQRPATAFLRAEEGTVRTAPG